MPNLLLSGASSPLVLIIAGALLPLAWLLAVSATFAGQKLGGRSVQIRKLRRSPTLLVGDAPVPANWDS